MPINLAAGAIEALSVGGNVVETSSVAVASELRVDFIGEQMNVLFLKGAGTGAAFIRGQHAKDAFLSINLTTGAWQVAAGAQGTLAPAGLTALQTALNAFRDRFENFAINNGIIAGTQTPTT